MSFMTSGSSLNADGIRGGRMRKLCLEGFTPLCEGLHLILNLVSRNTSDNGIYKFTMIAVGCRQFLLDSAASLFCFVAQPVPDVIASAFGLQRTLADFNQAVQVAEDQPVVVVLHADWCEC